MKLLDRIRTHSDTADEEDGGGEGALPTEAPRPQPEHEEPRLQEPTPRQLSKRDYLAVLWRSAKKASADHVTTMAAALAYYAFLAIPSVLLVAVGVFSAAAGPHAVNTVIDKLGTVMPTGARNLLDQSLTNLTKNHAHAGAIAVVGIVLAVWALSGAMQNVMWALNVVYDRDETRGFVKRRLIAFAMVFFALVAFALSFGLLVLGPHLSGWVGRAVGAEGAVKIAWWAAEWPLLVAGLLLAFAGILYLGPNVVHPRWRFLSFGAVFALLVWLAASGAFAFYASRFGSYNKTWGSLSAVVVMLTWLWLSSVALLFGAEINAEAERSRELRRGEPAEVELQAPTKS